MKRSMASGYAASTTRCSTRDNNRMLFGDAKKIPPGSLFITRSVEIRRRPP